MSRSGWEEYGDKNEWEKGDGVPRSAWLVTDPLALEMLGTWRITNERLRADAAF